jgi:hypothetical protein
MFEMLNREEFTTLLKKKKKNSHDWEKLEDFCCKNGFSDELFEYKYSIFKKKRNNYNKIKTSSFFDNLGVSVFGSVHTADNKTIGGIPEIIIYTEKELDTLLVNLSSEYYKKFHSEVPDKIIFNDKLMSLKEIIILLKYCLKNNLSIVQKEKEFVLVHKQLRVK